MANWVQDFYTSNKYAILWTAGYTIVAWAIMRYMFNFNIFSALRWHQLMHAHLHGFAGLVFGILILAMVPLYVATTVIISRNNAPLFDFKITIPQFIKNAFVQTPMDEPESENTDTPAVVAPTPTPDAETTQPEPQNESVPENVPAEMRVAYARARDNIGRAPMSAYDLGNVTKKATPEVLMTTTQPDNSESGMPIPMDFDINEPEKIIDNVPIFTDLDLDDDDDDDDTATSSFDDVKTVNANNDSVIKYLESKSIPYKTENDVVITDRFAIVSHVDSDFWVADNESWFASGKIRKSPIALVMESATAHNVQPVLYLAHDNIMDINELREQWTASGIHVITDLNELG